MLEAEGEKAKESCDKSLENLRAYTVDKVKLTIAITGTEGEDYPFECTIDDGQMFAGRCWDQTTYMWKASAMCHKPLYFEDEQLERYGHSFTPCFQPFVSGAHFFCTLPVLPYCMGVEPPCECVYALGHYRPGSCAPYMCNPVPLSLRGAVRSGRGYGDGRGDTVTVLNGGQAVPDCKQIGRKRPAARLRGRPCVSTRHPHRSAELTAEAPALSQRERENEYVLLLHIGAVAAVFAVLAAVAFAAAVRAIFAAIFRAAAAFLAAGRGSRRRRRAGVAGDARGHYTGRDEQTTE